MSTTRREISTVGIMFDGDGERESFPTLRDVAERSNYANSYSLGDALDTFGDWLVIAHDPRRLMYSDDDAEAMDETNYDAIVAELSHEPVRVFESQVGGGSYRYAWANVEEAVEARVAHIEYLLIIAPRDADYDDSDMDDLWNAGTLRARLSDYPLLDEDGYSAREFDAWQEYAPEAFEDEVRDARREHEDYASDSALDEVEEHADELLPILAQHLHYSYGFGGDYAPKFLTILADTLREPRPTDEECRQTTTAQDTKRVQELMGWHASEWIKRTL